MRDCCHVVLAAAAALSIGTGAQAHLISNGDFATGDFSDWTLFTTQEGELRGPAVVPFDTNGDGVPSLSARVSAGNRLPGGFGVQGGGLLQEFTTGEAILTITIDTAVELALLPTDLQVPQVGVHSLLLDGVVLDSFDFGTQSGSSTTRVRLSAQVPVAAGVHELQILMTRPNFTSGTVNILRYVDDVLVVPEPSTGACVGLGMMATGLWRRRLRSHFAVRRRQTSACS